MSKITRVAFIAALMAASSAQAHFFYAGPKVGMGIAGGSFSLKNNAAGGATSEFKGGALPSFIAGLGGGYMVTMNRFLLGLDVGLLYNSLNNEDFSNQVPGTSLNSKLKNNFLYQVAARFGFELCNKTVPFITLGLSGGNYKLSIKNDSAANNYGIAAGEKKTISKKTIGFMPGLGLLVPVTDSLLASFEYNVTFNKKFSKNFTTGANYTYSKRVVQHGLLVGLNWKF